jgi:hypothetical protein
MQLLPADGSLMHACHTHHALQTVCRHNQCCSGQPACPLICSCAEVPLQGCKAMGSGPHLREIICHLCHGGAEQVIECAPKVPHTVHKAVCAEEHAASPWAVASVKSSMCSAAQVVVCGPNMPHAVHKAVSTSSPWQWQGLQGLWGGCLSTHSVTRCPQHSVAGRALDRNLRQPLPLGCRGWRGGWLPGHPKRHTISTAPLVALSGAWRQIQGLQRIPQKHTVGIIDGWGSLGGRLVSGVCMQAFAAACASSLHQGPAAATLVLNVR